MKKLLAPFALFTLAVILLSSCSNMPKLSLTKRHYRSGYFVDFGRHKSNPAIVKLPVRNKQQNVPVVAAKSENSFAVNIPMVTLEKTILPQKKIQKQQPVALTAYSTKQSLAEPVVIAENPTAQNKQAFSEEYSAGGESAASAGLSLLWIVIVILLILWLVGLLAGGWGVGGLINILLIIALVLLILWLLRIV